METILQDKLSKVLFHGTLMDRANNIIENGVDFSKFNSRADFAKGFYLTDSYALAKRTALSRHSQELMKHKNVSSSVIMKFSVQINKFDKELSIKEFIGETLEWKKFVCTNRWYKKVLEYNPAFDNNIDSKYDIVIGLTADGKLANINKLIKEDKYNLSEEFLKNINPLLSEYSTFSNGRKKMHKTKSYQISFHNEEFVKQCLIYKDYDIIRDEKEGGHYE